jgi:peptidoglycan/xylan/chitin deacetylase (PgdA/CDA1 family)
VVRIYKFPKWLKRFYPLAIWDFFLNKESKEIYLTFDDGPTPEVSAWVLNELDKVNAKATFFCIGENVKKYPILYKQYLSKGHAVGNHTMNHLNGFKVKSKQYIENVQQAEEYIKSKLFRPPYGKCTPKQHKILRDKGYKTIFWSHITYDFDVTLPSDKRIKKFKANLKNGNIIVFHDSLKAFPQLKKDLPIMLDYLKQQGYTFCSIKE